MNLQKIAAWTEILEKITQTIVPEIAKPAADFVFGISQNLIDCLETENDRNFFIPKILPSLKTVQPILEGGSCGVFDTNACLSGTYENSVWKEIISQIEEIQDDSTKNACENFIIFIKSRFDSGEYEKMPVLFCIFTKIETTLKVFNAIKKSKPKKLYISSDCWREGREGEKEKVEYLRNFVLENIDWDCEVFTKFNEKNLGSRFGMEAAFDWFFENEEMGIILEDDTLPAHSFFRFCSEFLIKYKDEEKIFAIMGTNEHAKKSLANSYSFNKVTDFAEDITQFWGWATWRRAWKKHDKKMSQLEEYKKQCDIDDNTSDYEKHLKVARIKFFINQMELILAGKNNSWDLQFKFSILINDGLLVIPDCNLVTNIGCGISDAVHGAFEYAVGATLSTGEFCFPAEHKAQILSRPLTGKEYMRAAFMPIEREKDFWDIETSITDKILSVSNFLRMSDFSEEQKTENFRRFLSENLTVLMNISLRFNEYPKAQKYLFLALAKSVFRGEGNFCAKCDFRKCLSACPTESIKLSQMQDGELVVGINRKTCEYCWNCVKSCPVVAP